MFSSPTPHEQVMRKLEQLELQLAEANLAIVEMRKVQLQQQASMASMLGDMSRLVVANNDATVAHHSNFISILQAQSSNRVIRSINRNGGRLEPLQKENPSGDESNGGVHLANTLAPSGFENWQAWPPIALPLIGECPSQGMFPHTVEEAEKLDHFGILRLIAYYNDSFGIRKEDEIEKRREKFLAWCRF